MEPAQVRLTIPDSLDLTRLMGPADSLLRRIEASTDASITVRGNQVGITGEAAEANRIVEAYERAEQTDGRPRP